MNEEKQILKIQNKSTEYGLGILFIICSAFCFALMNLFIRLSGNVPSLQKCFFRNIFALIFAIITMLRKRIPFRIGSGNTKYLLARSVAGGLGMFCNFYAVDRMAISDASILNKLSPFCAIVFSAFILKEKADKYEWGAVILAFIGALFVVKPSFNVEVIPAVAGVFGGIGAGLAYTYVRKLGIRGEESMVIVAFFSAFTCLMLVPYLVFCYVPMEPVQWFFLVLTGLSAAGGQIFITKAYAKAPAKEISVYDYSIVIFTAIFGFLFLAQIPDYLSIIGYLIIIGTAVGKWFLSKKLKSLQ